MSANLPHRAIVLDPSEAPFPDLGALLAPWLPRSKVSIVKPLTPDLHPLAGMLGLTVADRALPSGPVLAAAFKVHPPDRSTVFHLSVMSVGNDGTVAALPPHVLTDQDSAALTESFHRLASKRLVPVQGQGLDHLLVWEEGSIDLHCHKPQDVVGHPWHARLPEGDGEPVLRQFIEDSLDLLDTHHVNRRLADQGLPKANLLWPHSFGFPLRLTNLPLKWGRTVSLTSQDLVVQGIGRLAGLKIADQYSLLPGAIVHIPAPPATTADPDSDLYAYTAEKTAALTATAVTRHLPPEPSATAFLLVVQGDPGLALVSHPANPPTNTFPFDPRVFDDTRLPTMTLPDLVDSFFQVG